MAVNVPVYEKCCYTTATRYKIEKKNAKDRRKQVFSTPSALGATKMTAVRAAGSKTGHVLDF